MVRKIVSGDIDVGIVGYDMFVEIVYGDDDIVIVYDVFGFGGCYFVVVIL